MKRLLALLLCLVMCITMIPAAYAGDIEIVDIEEEDLITLVEPAVTPEGEKLASKPTITTQPKSVTAYVGTTAKFTVKAENAASYQWYWRKNADASWARTTATGNKTATLTLEATTARNGFQYCCKVINDAGSVWSKSVTLTVSTKPVITTLPTNKTAAPGTTVKFTVKADGATSYQWYYRKTSSSSWVKSTASSSTSATLSIEATAARNGFQYKCAVKNAKGTTYSKVVTLTVQSKPSITTQPLSYTAGAGAYIYFKIKATGADSYQWQYRTSSSGTWYNSSATGNKTATLTVKVTEARNGFQYRCKAFNDAGTGYSKAATLTVNNQISFGQDIRWKLDSNGLLTFTGSGSTEDFGGMGMIPNPPNVFAEQITRVSIGKGITRLGWNLFSGCTRMTSVTLPDTLTDIGNYAFWGCSGLTAVTIPDSVTTIGYQTFKGCSALTTLAIPAALTEIGEGAFSECGSLTAFTVASGNQKYSAKNGVLFNKDKIVLVAYPGGKSGAYAVPAGVTNIGSYAFRGCAALTEVSFPDSLTGIGSWGFSGCSGLTKLTLPDSLTGISWYAFSNCSGLTAVTIPAGVEEIGFSAFSGCTGLTGFTVASGNQKYSAKNGVLFSKDQTRLVAYPCGKTGAYTIPAGVREISMSAFDHCDKLTGVTLPASLLQIGDSAFSSCGGLTELVIPDSVTNISGSAFQDCSNLAGLTLGSGLTRIGPWAFRGCKALKSITIPDSVTELSYGAFWDCTQLKTAVIGKGAAEIPDDCFCDCGALTTVTIPVGVTHIGWDAFFGCGTLADIYYRGSKTQWGKITINDGNDPLLNATMHYNA